MEFPKITSASNPHIKEAVRLRERKKTKGKDLFIIEGLRVIGAAMEAGSNIRDIFFTEHLGSTKECREVLRELSGKGAAIFEITERLLNKITDTETPQGIAAIVSYEMPTLKDLPARNNPLYAVCDGVRDPGNLGTIIRTADAAGADAVILLEGTCDVLSPKVIRATAGSIFHLPVTIASTVAFIEWLRRNEIRLVATDADANNSIFDARLDIPVALVFGNEARGVSDAVTKAAEIALGIPIYGKAESMNVAISAAVCLYEAARQRRAGKRGNNT